jgi:type I restriction enzyme S subunit
VPVVGGGGPSGFTDKALYDGRILITGRVGTLGKLFAPSGPCWPSDNALVIQPRSSQTDAIFLRYALQLVIPEAVGMNRGAANPLITQGDLGRLTIAYPPLPEQRAIAHILGTLDDKIELNRKQNETLEAMARALFKAWFVDFEPVRAKMEGRWQRGQSLPGLPAHLYDLFPDRLVESELGEIPEGWEITSVGDIAELTGGKQLEKKYIADRGSVPVFGGAGIMGYTENYNADGFVISVGRVGAYCGQFFSHRGKAWINNNASLIRTKDESIAEWLFISLQHADIDVIKKGAAQPFVSNGDIAKLRLICPGKPIIYFFLNHLSPIFEDKEENERQSRTLAQLRDTLLPKLISGALRVPDAEAFLKERGL